MKIKTSKNMGKSQKSLAYIFSQYLIRSKQTPGALGFTGQTLPGSGFGIFTDRDQRTIFLDFEFRKSAFFNY